MRYTDFSLRARDYDNSRFLVEVIGQMRAPEASSLDLGALARPLRKLESNRITADELIALGETLAGALFTPTVRELFVASLAATRVEQGLRLRLLLDAPALANLPWEYLYHMPAGLSGEKGRDGFLALHPRLSIVRHEAIPTPTPSVAAKLPLKLIAGLASPSDQAPLDLAAERRFVEAALTDAQPIDARFIENLSVAQLEAAGAGVHIFHFAGHGVFRADAGGGLLLSDAQGRAQFYDAERLALTLRALGVRVALLGACETAKRDGLRAWNSIAAALMKVGLGACVAMQSAIYDTSALAFNRAFYRALTAGLSLDEAVSAGRISIVNADDTSSADWGTPVLYLRAADGIVFPEAANDAALQPARIAVQQEIATLQGKLIGAQIGAMHEGEVTIAQKLGAVGPGGEVTGAQIERIEGGQLDVTQKAQKVEKGGSMTGVRLDRLG